MHPSAPLRQNGVMRVWIEFANSPHINLFGAMVRDLQREHEVVITVRPLANTIDLLDLHGFEYSVVGGHYGQRLASKLVGFPVRVMQLMRFLSGKRIDVAISQSSFTAPVAARLLGVRCIYLNDNERAMGNIPAFIFANKIMVPEFIDMSKLRRQGANPKKVVRYPGVKEGIYLWDLAARLDKNGRKLGCRSRKIVYIRPEPWLAQYYRGSRGFLDELLLGMKHHVDIVLLPRDAEQGKRYQHPKFSGIRVVTSAIDIADIALDCDLFIGAGGTMTREMAVLGIPTVSIYRDELLDVDRYLLDVGAFVHEPELTSAQALRYLESVSRRPPSTELLEKGKAAYGTIKNAIVNG